MTHIQTLGKVSSAPNPDAPKIIDSQKIPCTVICRRYDERLIGR